jgi:LysR family transcriptional regulator, regulator for bpeEF and oprC
MDRLTSMRVFVRVVDAGSFARTAEQLEMSAGMVTTHVASLERRLGVRLLLRTTRRLSLTDEGRAYYERCVRILDDVEEAEDAVAQSRGVARGRLRVEMPIAFARHWLIPSLPQFLATHPELILEIGLDNRVVNLVAQGYDCAVRSGTMPSSSMVARAIGALPWVTCASPGYLRRHGTPKDPAQLVEHHCIASLSSQTMQPMVWNFHKGAVQRTVRVTGRLGLNAMEDVAAAAAAGIGIARTLRKLAEPWLRDGRLRSVLTAWTSPPQPISIIYPHGRQLPTKVRVFADFLAAQLRDYDARPLNERRNRRGRFAMAHSRRAPGR